MPIQEQFPARPIPTPEKNTYLLQQNIVSFEYPEVMGFELTEGRFFSKGFPTDSTGVIINEKAVKMLGWDPPIVGRIIIQPKDLNLTVIGVVKDFNIKSLQNPIEPIIFTVMHGNMEGYLSVRLKTDKLQETIRKIESKWYDYSSSQPFQYFFFDDEFNAQYQSEVKTGRIFLVFAILAVFIACLGLLGLIAYTTTVRTKEIGIRKVHGASVSKIVTILSSEIIWLIVISALIAWPVAYFATKFWLQDFANRISVSPLIYIASTLIALVTGWIAISIQAIRAANRNPAESLRYE